MNAEKLAYTYDEAALACGVSVDVIRRAVNKGDLIPVYPTRRPVIQADELREWLTTQPTTPRRAAS